MFKSLTTWVCCQNIIGVFSWLVAATLFSFCPFACFLKYEGDCCGFCWNHVATCSIGFSLANLVKKKHAKKATVVFLTTSWLSDNLIIFCALHCLIFRSPFSRGHCFCRPIGIPCDCNICVLPFDSITERFKFQAHILDFRRFLGMRLLIAYFISSYHNPSSRLQKQTWIIWTIQAIPFIHHEVSSKLASTTSMAIELMAKLLVLLVPLMWMQKSAWKWRTLHQ